MNMSGYRPERYCLPYVQAERARYAEPPVHNDVHAQACTERYEVSWEPVVRVYSISFFNFNIYFIWCVNQVRS